MRNTPPLRGLPFMAISTCVQHIRRPHQPCMRRSLGIVASAHGPRAPSQALAVSVFAFKRREFSESVSRTMSWASTHTLYSVASVWLPIMMFYTPVHIFTSVVAISFLLLPVNYAAALWVGSLTVYYLVTGTGEPEHTGGALMRKRRS